MCFLIAGGLLCHLCSSIHNLEQSFNANNSNFGTAVAYLLSLAKYDGLQLVPVCLLVCFSLVWKLSDLLCRVTRWGVGIWCRERHSVCYTGAGLQQSATTHKGADRAGLSCEGGRKEYWCGEILSVQVLLEGCGALFGFLHFLGSFSNARYKINIWC